MQTGSSTFPLSMPEIWGGLECTINRVGDQYTDQLALSGHYGRSGDIGLIAALGIKTLRYPVLWERHQSEALQKIDWSFTASRMQELRDHQITPIAGLLHHGSGPLYTGLDDPGFPDHFAGYAREVASAFPWIGYYTPINEPLTTARFSGLYGHWYPHKKSASVFLRLLLHQLKATVLAMREIRKINPSAKLVQTEDLGKTHSTPTLQFQADFENERRWLTYDLLCGRIGADHPLWNYLLDNGITPSALSFFREHTCPPDIMGLNYYVTSERWLDESIGNYPESTHGGNGRLRYADTEAVQARPGKMQGLAVLLQEAWQRFGLPIAVTEIHLTCTREEQLRWFNENREHCCALKRKGVPVVAITAWSMFGAIDWNSLLTKKDNHYDPGVFDVSSKVPRPTALARLISQMNNGETITEPLLRQRGWWHKGMRENTFLPGKRMEEKKGETAPPLLIFGSTGMLGTAFIRMCQARSIPCKALSRSDINIESEKEVSIMMGRYKPWAVINATGFTEIENAGNERERCFRINSAAPGMLAEICKNYGARFVTFSSDQVFDGRKNEPYTEIDNVNPQNIFGESKALGELVVKTNNPQALIIRTSSVFGSLDSRDIIETVLSTTQIRGSYETARNQYASPTYLPELIRAVLDLLIDKEHGVWHLVNHGAVRWSDLAIDLIRREGLPYPVFIRNADGPTSYPEMPVCVALSSIRGKLLPALHQSLDLAFSERRVRHASVLH